MSNRLVAFLICFYLPSALAEANDDHNHHLNNEYRILHQSILENQKGVAVLMVQEGGHLLGQPYQVELRVHCGELLGNPLEIPVKDSFSVCDLKPESVKVNQAKTAIAIKTKQADVAHYDEQVGRGVLRPEVRCLEKTSIKKFSLRNLCD